MTDLTHIWAGLVALAMVLYVVLDGTTLGIGLLFPTAATREERDLLIASIAPVWDANQTWLVFGGGAIFAVFPMAYGVLSSAFYLPLMTFIFGLIFRGVTFEFRAHARRKETWDRAFFYGSLVAVVSQGLILGGILTGVSVQGENFSGGQLDWLNPFSALVGISLIPGYVLLGATHLIRKTTGPVQERAFRQAFRAGWLVLALMAFITVWSPLRFPLVLENWSSRPRLYFFWAFPLLGLGAFYGLLKALRARREILPRACTIILFLAGFIGLATSLYPYAIPPAITIQMAAAQKETLRFMLWGTAIVLPVVLGYVIYSYSVFRGKVGGEKHY